MGEKSTPYFEVSLAFFVARGFKKLNYIYKFPQRSQMKNSYCYHYTDTIVFNFKMYKYIQ